MFEVNRRAPNGNNISLIISEDNLWFSQRNLCLLFSVTKQNISLYVLDVAKNISPSRIRKSIQLVQTEGQRSIKRSIQHYSFGCVHAIAMRGQFWHELNWLVELSEEFLKSKEIYRVTQKKERSFSDLLIGCLKDITDIIPQYFLNGYYIDFFIPEYRIAVEYDELHHLKAKHKDMDQLRENIIKSVIPFLEFVRITEGEEVQGLNIILKKIITQGVTK